MALPKRADLIIVQSRETQFDAPLYQLIHQRQIFALEVIYTTFASHGADRDDELGFAPLWDHLLGRTYPHRHLRSTTLLAIWRLARQLHQRQPKLVIIFGYYPRCQLFLAIFLRIMGQRIGLRSDNTLHHTELGGWKGRARSISVGAIQRLFHTWHPVGEQALTYLRTLSGEERPTYRFSYSVDNDWLASQAAHAVYQKPRYLEDQGWPQDAYVILGIMKWTDREDPLTLIHAFSLLVNQCSSARLILVGAGPLTTEVNRALQPLINMVHCPGYQPYSSLPRWYSFADVFVHPSPDEPWGVSVIEALACGVPVVAASGVGAATELIKPDFNGSIFSNGNVNQLAQILQGYVSDPNRSQFMRPHCVKSADNWHYRNTIHNFQKALRDA